MGMAMMGSAVASGVERSKVAAEQAVACPLLEGVDLSNARGVLVNITSSKTTLRMKEVYDVMNAIKTFTADGATVIVGAVFDEAMQDDLRVTMVATGLGGAVNRSQKPLTVIASRTGTDNIGMEVDYGVLDQPAVIRKRNREATVEAMRQSGVETFDIPAFLRKQAD
jgi:cell division protein FtsZ